MKRILIILMLFISFGLSAQVTNVAEYRITNATTAFGRNIPIGTKVYDINADAYWVANAAVVSTATLTTASASFDAIGGGDSSPLTTKGDLYTFTTVDARQPIGTDGYVLTADAAEATGMKWAASSSSAPTRQTLATNDATLDFDTSSGTWAKIDGLQQNTTLTFTVAPDFTQGRIRVRQDATGGFTLTIAESVTAITTIEYSGGLENIQVLASKITNIEYTVDESYLFIDKIWYE